MPRIDLITRLAALVLAAAVALGATAALAQYEPGYPDYDEEVGGAPLGPVPGQGRAPRVQLTEGAQVEWIVIGPDGQSAAVEAAIRAAGGRVVRAAALPALGQATTVAAFPGDAARERAAAAITALGAQLSLHHLYDFAQSGQVTQFGTPRIYAPVLIGDGEGGRCRLPRAVSIGMIDGPVNTDHPALRGTGATHESLVPHGSVPQADHGTAVAVLLVGEDPSGLLAGFARGARLHAVSVFADREGDAEASVERIAAAIDLLVGRGVRLINLSLAGPENAALARALNAAAARGAVLVGASGNERRAVVAWPAAAPEVIAVTAVDASRRRFRMANTGAELEFAAPGVDVYAARARGAGYVSGTSFAAPIVTALAARAMASGRSSPEAVRAALRAGVQPLGAGSRNTDFGFGLVRSGGC